MRTPESWPDREALPGARAENSGRDRRTLGIAVVLVTGVAVLLPIWLGVSRLSLLGAFVALLMLSVWRLDAERRLAARLGAHLVALGAIALVAYACYGIGIPPVIAVYFSTLVILGSSHMLGARAATAWSVPCLLLNAAVVLVPPERVYPVDAASTLFTRTATLLTVLAFSVSFRLHQDRQARELERMAMSDSLTGLANRRQMERALQQAVDRSARFERRCAVVFVDVDGLKRVNDERGHEVGDLLISEIAKRIAGGARRVDTVARIGGDEFVIVLSEVRDEEGIERFARSLLERISEPVVLADGLLRPSVSIGSAMYPAAGTSPKELLRQADEAMYAAKQSGGGCLFRHDGRQAGDLG